MALDLQLVYRRIAEKDPEGLFPRLLSVFFAYERWFLVEQLVDGCAAGELRSQGVLGIE